MIKREGSRARRLTAPEFPSALRWTVVPGVAAAEAEVSQPAICGTRNLRRYRHATGSKPSRPGVPVDNQRPLTPPGALISRRPRHQVIAPVDWPA